MKIFPLRPVSTLDRIKSLYKIIIFQKPVKTNTLKSDVANFSDDAALKKGRNICDMLSE